MQSQTYHDRLAVIAAGNVSLKAQMEAAKAYPAVPVAQPHRKVVAKSRRQAVNGSKLRACFPNNLGGYPGYNKKPDQPPVKPLSPDERFARLAAAYIAGRRNYRFLQPMRGFARATG